MDDTPEEVAPKGRSRTGKGSSRKSAAVTPAGKTRARPISNKQATVEAEKGSAKAAARRKAPAKGETAAKSSARKSNAVAAPAETKNAAKKSRTPASPEQSRQKAVEVLSAPAVPAHAETSLSEPQKPAPAELPGAKQNSNGSASDVTIHPVEPHALTAHPHDDGLEFGLSPVDLAPDATVSEEAGLDWFIRILVLSSVLLVLFNSFAIDKWSREQPVTPYNSRVLIAAQQFHAEMKGFRLDVPLEGMRWLWHGVRDARWPGSADDAEQPTAENSSAK